jgi:hypothetical protein
MLGSNINNQRPGLTHNNMLDIFNIINILKRNGE